MRGRHRKELSGSRVLTCTLRSVGGERLQLCLARHSGAEPRGVHAWCEVQLRLRCASVTRGLADGNSWVPFRSSRLSYCIYYGGKSSGCVGSVPRAIGRGRILQSHRQLSRLSVTCAGAEVVSPRSYATARPSREETQRRWSNYGGRQQQTSVGLRMPPAEEASRLAALPGTPSAKRMGCPNSNEEMQVQKRRPHHKPPRAAPNAARQRRPTRGWID